MYSQSQASSYYYPPGVGVQPQGFVSHTTSAWDSGSSYHYQQPIQPVGNIAGGCSSDSAEMKATSTRSHPRHHHRGLSQMVPRPKSSTTTTTTKPVAQGFVEVASTTHDQFLVIPQKDVISLPAPRSKQQQQQHTEPPHAPQQFITRDQFDCCSRVSESEAPTDSDIINTSKYSSTKSSSSNNSASCVRTVTMPQPKTEQQEADMLKHKTHADANCDCADNDVDVDEGVVYDLRLCPNFDPRVPGSCPQGAKCRFVHAVTRNAKSRDVHVNYVWRSPEDIIYDCFPKGQMFHVAAPNASAATDEIPSHLILKTRALESNRRVMSHCAHFFFNRTCNRGTSCYFIHAVSVAPAQQEHETASSEEEEEEAAEKESPADHKVNLDDNKYRRVWGRITSETESLAKRFCSNNNNNNDSDNDGTASDDQMPTRDIRTNDDEDDDKGTDVNCDEAQKSTESALLPPPPPYQFEHHFVASAKDANLEEECHDHSDSRIRNEEAGMEEEEEYNDTHRALATHVKKGKKNAGNKFGTDNESQNSDVSYQNNTTVDEAYANNNNSNNNYYYYTHSSSTTNNVSRDLTPDAGRSPAPVFTPQQLQHEQCTCPDCLAAALLSSHTTTSGDSNNSSFALPSSNTASNTNLLHGPHSSSTGHCLGQSSDLAESNDNHHQHQQQQQSCHYPHQDYYQNQDYDAPPIGSYAAAPPESSMYQPHGYEAYSYYYASQPQQQPQYQPYPCPYCSGCTCCGYNATINTAGSEYSSYSHLQQASSTIGQQYHANNEQKNQPGTEYQHDEDEENADGVEECATDAAVMSETGEPVPSENSAPGDAFSEVPCFSVSVRWRNEPYSMTSSVVRICETTMTVA